MIRRKKYVCVPPAALAATYNLNSKFLAAKFSLEPRLVVAKAGVAFSCAVGAGMRPRVLIRPRSIVDPKNVTNVILNLRGWQAKGINLQILS